MRIRNLFRNSFFSMLSQFALLILGFFSQRAMNLYMGAELVGMNGVISNVINRCYGYWSFKNETVRKSQFNHNTRWI